MKRILALLTLAALCSGCVNLSKPLAREMKTFMEQTAKPAVDDALADGKWNGRELKDGEANGIRANVAKMDETLDKALGE